MMVARRRQMARLERLAAPRVEQIRVAKAQLEQEMANRIYSDALVHAANLSLIILFGAPRIEEPLSIAWERSCKSVSPELCGDVSRENMLKEYISPFDELGACCNASFFGERVLPRLPGTNLREKLAPLFADAPLWLLWFTRAELTMGALDLPLRDLSTIYKFHRPKDGFKKWPVLLSGKFENIQMSDREVAELIRKTKESPLDMGLLEYKYRSAIDAGQIPISPGFRP